MKKTIKVSSSKETSDFYDKLMEGDAQRGILGVDKRFNVDRTIKDPSTKKYFYEKLKGVLAPTDKVLDFGCGPGGFMAVAAPLCKEIVGVDISKAFVDAGEDTIKRFNIKNASVKHVEPEVLPYQDGEFDAVIIVDVIHHLEDIDTILKEVWRVLKPEGKIIIFEPNKLNPLLYLVHLADKNEWGLLALGTPSKYRKLLSPIMDIKELSFNGIVIGPQSKIFRAIADLLNVPFLKPLIGWLNPKIMIHGVKTVK